jgi:hypothetical protein
VSGFREMERRSLDRPPRRVTRRAAFRVLFGSLPSRLGWLFLAFGLFGLRSALIQAREESWFQGPLETRVGHVTQSYELRSGKRHTPTGQYGVEFQYAAVPGGPESSSGHSYTWDREQIPRDGADVVVEVPAAHPGLGRIQNLSLHASREVPELLAIPLLGALGALGFGFFRGRRQLRLLVDSRLAPATLDRHDAPGFFQKRQHVLYFVYNDHHGIARSVIVGTSLPGRFKRGGGFLVAHDDSDPPRAVLLQALPGAPALGEDQVFRDEVAGLDALLSLVLPAVGIVTSLAATVAVLRVL